MTVEKPTPTFNLISILLERALQTFENRTYVPDTQHTFTQQLSKCSLQKENRQTRENQTDQVLDQKNPLKQKKKIVLE